MISCLALYSEKKLINLFITLFFFIFVVRKTTKVGSPYGYPTK